jgi:hypothetical protein
MPNQPSFNGTWTCIWEDDTCAQLVVDANHSFQCFGSSYMLNTKNDGVVSFNWPSDGTLQTLNSDITENNVRVIQWTTTNADYLTIRWEMQLQQ